MICRFERDSLIFNSEIMQCQFVPWLCHYWADQYECKHYLCSLKWIAKSLRDLQLRNSRWLYCSNDMLIWTRNAYLQLKMIKCQFVTCLCHYWVDQYEWKDYLCSLKALLNRCWICSYAIRAGFIVLMICWFERESLIFNSSYGMSIRNLTLSLLSRLVWMQTLSVFP